MVSAGLSVDLVLTVALMAYVPAVIYAILIRYVEKYDREPWGSIWVAFLWGATLSVIIVTIVKGWYLEEIPDLYPEIASNSTLFFLYGDVLLIPFVAELVKLAGAYWVYEDMVEAEDGLIYGTVIGLGYASTKVLIYGLSVGILYGTDELMARVAIASVSLLLANAAITSISVYGVSRVSSVKHSTKHSPVSVVPFFLAAYAMHVFFAYVVNFGYQFFPEEMRSNFVIQNSIVVTVAVVYGIIISIIVYLKIWRLDRLDEAAAKDRKARAMERARRNAAGVRAPPPPPRKALERARRDVRPPERPAGASPSGSNASRGQRRDEMDSEWEVVEEDEPVDIIEDDDDWMDV